MTEELQLSLEFPILLVRVLLDLDRVALAKDGHERAGKRLIVVEEVWEQPDPPETDDPHQDE